jgi:Putative peptidoglycan binding domain
METDSGSKSAIFLSQRLLRGCPQVRKMIFMRLITNFIAGSLVTGILALAPATSFARGGGGGGGHFGGGGGGHFGGFNGGRGAGAWHHDGGWAHHSSSGYYGYYGPFDYGLDGSADPYYDDSDSFDVQPGSTDPVPDEPTSLIVSVQKELARLGYYHGQIDGMTGSETAQALRWFQSVDKLPVSGQIDSATLQALRIG